MPSNSPLPASAYILTCNSERTLERALTSVQCFEQIIVVDSGSTDATLDIARAHGAEVHQREWPGFAAQKQYAKSLCRHPWVFDLDSDEEVDPGLIDEIEHFLAHYSRDYQGLSVPIHDIFLAATRPRGMHLNRRIKFYRSDCGDYDTDRLVHETVQLRGTSRKTRHLIWHYGMDSIETKLNKINRYAGLRAAEKAAAGKRASLLGVLLAMPVAFLRSWILRRRCLAGRSGFIDSMLNGFYAFLKQAKLYELGLQTDHNPERSDHGTVSSSSD